MIQIKKDEGNSFDAPGQYNSWTLKKLTPEMGSKKLKMSYSHFLPGGGCDMGPSPSERLYYVISGKLEVSGKNHDVYSLEPGDMLYVAPGEERAARVIGNESATVLNVIVAP